jgi:hypothetical protein
MLSVPRRTRVLALGAVCAAAGAGAGAIATAGATAPGHHTAPEHHTAAAAARRVRGRAARRGRFLRRAVHGELVVHTPSGFATATFDRGTVDAVSGAQLTLTDGTPRSDYRQQTLTIPASARVRNDRRPATLSSLTAGERVFVMQLPTRTVVIARAPQMSSASSSRSSSS